MSIFVTLCRCIYRKNKQIILEIYLYNKKSSIDFKKGWFYE